MSQETREALIKRLFFKDETDGTAEPTQRRDLLTLLEDGGTDSGLIEHLIDVANAGIWLEITAVRTDHHNDGLNGHNSGGRAADGWFLNGPTPGDWMDANTPQFARALEVVAGSNWRFQTGLAGTAYTAANMAALGGQPAIDSGAAFEDEGADHIHFGAKAA